MKIKLVFVTFLMMLFSAHANANYMDDMGNYCSYVDKWATAITNANERGIKKDVVIKELTKSSTNKAFNKQIKEMVNAKYVEEVDTSAYVYQNCFDDDWLRAVVLDGHPY